MPKQAFEAWMSGPRNLDFLINGELHNLAVTSNRKGLRVKHAVQRGICIPTKYLLSRTEETYGKPCLRCPVAGTSAYELTSASRPT
jgi:hypothetical protein